MRPDKQRFGCHHNTNGDGFTVQQLTVLRQCLKRMAEGVAKIQYRANTRFAFVLRHHFCFYLT